MHVYWSVLYQLSYLQSRPYLVGPTYPLSMSALIARSIAFQSTLRGGGGGGMTSILWGGGEGGGGGGGGGGTHNVNCQGEVDRECLL